jgi:hypothetical protein
MKKPGPNRAVEPWKKIATFTSSATIFFKNGVKQEEVYSPQFLSYGSNFILGLSLRMVRPISEFNFAYNKFAAVFVYKML